jgi:hypothetical protein
MDNLIYHYCSINTFFEIIKNKKLWLNDSSYMNDKYEITWTDKIVYEAIDELEKELKNDKLVKLTNFRTEYKKFKSKKHYFISFSKDGDLLSQWRGYADNGRGVSIGFPDYLGVSEKFHLCGQVNFQQITRTDEQLGYEEIDYDGKNSTKKYILDAIKKRDNYELDVAILKESATMYKHSSFYEEKEVRITYTPKELKDREIEKLSIKKFRYQNNMIIPYYEFDFTNNGITPKLEIRFGPKCQLIKHDVEDFLKYHGFESFEIKDSKSSYR